MKLKNEHFCLLIFAVNFVSFQFVQDYIRPQYAGDSSLIRYFLGVVPNFFPSVGIPSLFMVLLPILFSGSKVDFTFNYNLSMAQQFHLSIR